MLKPRARSSDQDKLDNTKANYFETAVYLSFKVDIFDIINIKAQLGKSFHIQPSEVDKMPFWELEFYLKELEKLVKEENDTQEAEMNQSGVRDAMKMANPNNMSKMTNSMMPKMPNMNMPNMSMPNMNIKMPSMK